MSLQKKKSDDQTQSQSPSKRPDEPVTATVGSKESPPAALDQDKLIKEVQERSRQADLEAEKQVEEAIGAEARLSKPQVKIGPDLADHGVKSPEQEASDVLKNGTTLELPITEAEYKKGEHTKANGDVINKSVIGVSSLLAMVLLFGKWIKLAHKHAKKVIFKNSTND